MNLVVDLVSVWNGIVFLNVIVIILILAVLLNICYVVIIKGIVKFLVLELWLIKVYIIAKVVGES